MKKVISLILFVVSGAVYSQTNCPMYEQSYVPENLKDAIEYLTCKWPNSKIERYKNLKEEYAALDLLFVSEKDIISNWGLDKGKNKISRYFKSKGISNSIDMFTIILTSLHRHLNNKHITVNEQIRNCKNYWKDVKEKQRNLKRKFRKLKVQSSLLIPFFQGKIYDGTSRFTLRNYHTFIDKYYPENPKELKCLIQGKIVTKKKIGKDYLLTLLITNCNLCSYKNMMYKGKKVAVNELIEINMVTDRVIID